MKGMSTVIASNLISCVHSFVQEMLLLILFNSYFGGIGQEDEKVQISS